MKRTLKLLIPVVLLALLAGTIGLFVSAEDTVRYTVTDNDTGAVQNFTEDSLSDLGTVTGNKTVDLKSDVAWGSNNNVSVEGNLTINLNGYTLKMDNYSKTGLEGRFQINANDATLTINGGTNASGDKGAITSGKVYSRFYSQKSGSAINLNGVNVSSAGVIMDIRVGTVTANGCSFTTTDNAQHSFSLANSGSVDVAFNFTDCEFNTDSGTYMFQFGRKDATTAMTSTLTMERCTVNAPYLRRVFYRVTESNDIEGELHTVNLNNTTLNAPLADMFYGESGNAQNKYKFAPNMGAATEIDVNSFGVGLTAPAGYKVAYTGMGYKCKIAPEADTVSIKYKEAAGNSVTRVMLLDSVPGVLKTYTNKSNLYIDTDGKVKTDKYVTGFTDEEGNPVTVIDGSDTTLNVVRGTRTAYWAEFSAKEQTQDNLLWAQFDDNNIYEALSAIRKAPYVYVYQDIVFQGSTTRVDCINWSVTVDLNDNTLTMSTTSTEATKSDFCFRPQGSDGTMTIRNGKVVTVNTKIFYPFTSGECKLEKLDIKAGAAIIDARGKHFTITDCNIDVVTGGLNLFSINMVNGSQNATYTFDNVKITSENGSTLNRLFSCSRNNSNNVLTLNVTGLQCDVGFTMEAVSIGTQHVCTVNISDSEFLNAGGKKLFNLANATDKFKLTIDGIVLDELTPWTASVLKNATLTTAPVIAYNGRTDAPYTLATSGYQTDKWNVLGRTDTTYTMAGAVPLCTSVFVINTDDLGVDTLYYIDASWAEKNLGPAEAGRTLQIDVGTDNMSVATYAIFDSAGNLMQIGTDDEITPEQLQAIAESGKLVIYSDILVPYREGDASNQTDIALANGVTLDLNKHSLKLGRDRNDGTYEFVRFTAAQGCESIKITDGTVSTYYNLIFLNNDKSPVITLSEVTLNQPKNTVKDWVCFDLRRGTLNVTDCVINGAASITAMGYRGSTTYVDFSGCTVSGEKFMSVKPNSSGGPYDLTSKITVQGSTLNLSESFGTIVGNVHKDSTVHVTITNSTLNTPAPLTSSKAVNTTTGEFTDIKVTYSEIKAGFDPATAENVQVTLSKDQVVVLADDPVTPYCLTNSANVAKVEANLTLYNDFTLNFFLPSTAIRATVNGRDAELIPIEGGYVVKVQKIAANKVADEIVLVLEYQLGKDVKATKTVKYSVLAYAYDIINGEFNANAKALLASAVRYIAASYDYAGYTKPAQLSALMSDSDYTSALPTLPAIPATETDHSALSPVINSIQLGLSSSLAYRINFNPAFTGTVDINGLVLQVENGKANGYAFVNIYLTAHTFNDGITVKAVTDSAEFTGTYDLAAYALAKVGENQALDTLIVTLYAYGEQAKSYKNDPGSEEPDMGDDTKTMKSVLLIGQSNMAGRGKINEVDPISDDRIFMQRNGAWVKMQEPIHQDKPQAGVGLAASFAKGFVDSFDTEIGLIPAAFGGTSLDDWAVGGTYYNDALDKARAAQQTSEICAILWHQGESNQGNRTPETYAADLKEILDGFIADLGLDKDKVVIITGELGEFRVSSRANVNDGLKLLAGEYRNYGVASSKSLVAFDTSTHFDSASLRVFGYRYFAIFYKLLTGKDFAYNDDVDFYRSEQEVEEGDDTRNYLININFDSAEYDTSAPITSDTSVGGGYFKAAGGSHAFVLEDGSNTNKYLEIDRISSSGNPYVDVAMKPAVAAGSTIIIEASFRCGENFAARSELLKLMDSNSKSASLIAVDTDGKLYDSISGDLGQYLGVSLSSLNGEWTHVKIVVHLDTNTKDVYLNGSDTAIIMGGTFINTNKSNAPDPATYAPTKIRVGQFKGNVGTTGKVMVDDFVCYLAE